MAKKDRVHGSSDTDTIYGYTPPTTDAPPPNGDAPPAKKPVLSKRERFLKHATRRTLAACKRLAHVGNLASRASYEYTEVEAEKIVAKLEEAFLAMASRFRGTTVKQDQWTL